MKKLNNILFIATFALCLLLPAIKMEFGKDIKSEIDNEYLPELETENLAVMTASMNNYVDKRIGFRKEALYWYQKINDRVFTIMDHPSYMYGKNGHVYFKGEKFVKNYQHLNLDQEYADSFANGLLSFQNYARDNGAEFMYFYIPDKESVYPEFYPEGINVYGDVSRTDQILQALDERDVEYYFAKDVMVKAKDTTLVNNIKYDAGHWNHNGAFVSIQKLYTLLQKEFPQLMILEKEEFNIEDVVMETLPVSDFEINEKVPVYTLKQTSAINKTDSFRENVLISYPDNYVAHYENPACKEQPSLLIFGDSYLSYMDDFFINHFSEYTYIHRYNVYNEEFFAYYFDILRPDIVIYETPERSHPIDLHKSNTIN